MTESERLITDLKGAYGEVRSAVDGLSDEQAAQVAFDGWSAKDILAHLLGWNLVVPRFLQRIAQGERPVPDGEDYSDVDRWNATFVKERQGASLHDLLRDFDATEPTFVEAVRGLSEDRLANGKTAHRLVKVSSADHMREHAGQIREWRKQAGV